MDWLQAFYLHAWVNSIKSTLYSHFCGQLPNCICYSHTLLEHDTSREQKMINYSLQVIVMMIIFNFLFPKWICKVVFTSSDRVWSSCVCENQLRLIFFKGKGTLYKMLKTKYFYFVSFHFSYLRLMDKWKNYILGI